jgi:hypothetical protein
MFAPQRGSAARLAQAALPALAPCRPDPVGRVLMAIATHGGASSRPTSVR